MQRKNKTIICVIAAVTAVLILAACPNETEETNRTLRLSGQVHERKINADLESLLDLENPDLKTLLALAESTGVTYNNYTGSFVIDDSGLGGTGAVTNGKLTYTVEEPAADTLQTLNPALDDTKLGGLYSNFTVTPTDAMGAAIVLSSDNDEPLTLETFIPFTMEHTKIAGEAVSYIYVDRNVTVSADGGTVNNFMGITIPVSLNTNDINLKLIKGWNSVKAVFTLEYNLTTLTPTGTVTVSSGEPSADTSALKWTLNTAEQFNQ